MLNNWNQTVHEIAEKRLARTRAEYESERAKLIDAIEARDSQLEVALGILQYKPKGQKLKVDTGKSEAVAFAVASDWHVEETVEAKSVNNLNKFNLQIAEERINRFFQRIARMTEIQRSGAKIDDLVLVLGGDLMTGYIHEELQETNALSPTETVLWLIDRLTSGIDFLSKNFERITIPCVYGNHGRTTKKPRHGTGATNSYEWMMYHVLAKHLQGKAEFSISDGYHLYLDVAGKTVRIHHGDGLKYQGGIGGLTIPVEKAIASWNKGISADLDVFGHWHQSQQNPKWICNGSLIGHNAYSIAIKAPFEKPSQTYFLLDKRHGRTVTAPILLSE